MKGNESVATKRKKTKPISISLEHPENNPKAVTVRKVILNEGEPLGFIPMPVELNSESTTVTQNEIDPELKNTNQKETVEMSNATKSNEVNAVTETQPEAIQPVVPKTENVASNATSTSKPETANSENVNIMNTNTNDQTSTQPAVKSLTSEERDAKLDELIAALQEQTKSVSVGRTLMTGLVLGVGMTTGCILVEKLFACLDR